MVLRAVVWDFGGVLLRTEDYRPREKLAERLGLSRTELERLVFSSELGWRAQRGEITVAQFWEALRQQFGFTPDEMLDFQRDFWGGDCLDMELVAYIRALHFNFKIGLLSNAFSDLRRYIEEEWKIGDAFDQLIISSEVGMMKPDELIYQVTAERLNILPSEIVFIDDFLRNVEGALRVGMKAIHFKDSVQVKMELEELLGGIESE